MERVGGFGFRKMHENALLSLQDPKSSLHCHRSFLDSPEVLEEQQAPKFVLPGTVAPRKLTMAERLKE